MQKLLEEEMQMISARDALQQLQDGNKRYATDASERGAMSARRGELINSQNPFATVIGCSDSRVPVEMVFDQGLGDLFVIRVAGNIIAPSQIGSVEFAAERFGVQLVVILGHSQCGAVQATVDSLVSPGETNSRNLNSIVDRIKPSVAELLATDLKNDREALIEHAVRANVRSAVQGLKHGSDIIEQLVREKKLLIVGAEYHLSTGLVDFFDGLDSPMVA